MSLDNLSKAELLVILFKKAVKFEEEEGPAKENKWLTRAIEVEQEIKDD